MWRKEDIKRFWSYVDKNGPIPTHCPELGPCWEWSGTDRGVGYGVFKVQGRMVAAHRFAYQLAHGETTHSILHRCDNKKCCRESHLFPGTHLANMQDKVAKGRQYRPVGSLNSMAKLTKEKIEKIKAMREKGKLQREIGEKFGICQASVSMVLSGKRWNQ